ncbi:hypothetical protein I4U23_022299 [Adineta vaga]|nr:hypothetical protein I4U23_022299 [Adineta vaga]
MHRRGNRRSSEDEEDMCRYLTIILSFIDLIPLFGLLLTTSPNLNEAPPRLKFIPENNQTWPQFFANCSYQLNFSGNYSIVCHKAIGPVSSFFLTTASFLAFILLIVNLVTVTRELSRNELIIRTVMHMIYALILFTTGLTYTLTHYECSNCGGYLLCFSIPIPTTFFMACNWYDDDEQIHSHQQISVGNQSLQLRPSTSNHLSVYSGRIVSNQLSSSIPRHSPENNEDPQLENEFNEWLEAQQRHN